MTAQKAPERDENNKAGKRKSTGQNPVARFFIILFKYLRIIFRPLFKLFRFFFQSLFIICVLALIASIAVGVTVIYPKYEEFSQQAVEIVAESDLDTFRLQESSYIYDNQGDVIAKLTKDEDSTYLPYEEIPEDAINAFIAIEDRTFWENSGFDLKGIIRVGLNYFRTEGEEVQDVYKRQVVVLYYFNQMTAKEISKAIGCMEGTVKSRLYAARRNLRLLLEGQEKEDFYERRTV